MIITSVFFILKLRFCLQILLIKDKQFFFYRWAVWFLPCETFLVCWVTVLCVNHQHSICTIHIRFLRCHSVQFINMQSVQLFSLQGGRFDRVKRITTSFLSVKVLHLNYQGISVLDQSYINGPNMIFVNLSHNSIHTIHRNAFGRIQNIKILSLISNYLQNLESYFCTLLTNLTYLYLSDNPLVNIASDVFLETPRLLVIRSDWCMVCCVAVHVEDCHPQNQLISSCSNLYHHLHSE